MGKARAKATPKRAKKVSPKKKVASAGGSSLATLESKLQRLDRDLLRMFNERARLATKIGKHHHAEDQTVARAGGDAAVLGQAAALNKGPLSERSVRATFRELLSGCRSLRERLRVAFLGPLYSYSHLAVIYRFGQSIELSPVGSIAAVFEEVNRGQSNFGLVPLENSTDGRIADTLDMFTRLPVGICGEVELEIHHALLGKCVRAEIHEVYSRPQALSQCRNWLAKHLPSARSIEVTSTSTAAQLAIEKPGAAAVASLQAGAYYGLDVLAERIEDNKTNATRFALIGDMPSKRTGNDRTALMIQTEHRFGALADALNIFKRDRVNLTWIESFPIPGSQRAYLFFIELEGHESNARVRRCIQALEKKTLRLKVLGCFPAAVPGQ